MKRIDSVKNERIKQWKKLHSRKGREKANQFLIEGFHLIEEALKSNVVVQHILLEEGREWPAEWKMDDAERIEVHITVLKELSDTMTPQGVIAICELPNDGEIDNRNGCFLLVDRIQDPGNLGTIIRTADAAGMTGVILGEGCVDPFNSKVLRSSQGSLFHLPIYHGPLTEWVRAFKEVKVPILGTALQNASSYTAIEPLESFALIVGNEGEGVDQDLLKQTNQNVYIPIYGKAESLNVAIATGILLYHLRR
ncbi:TrmH family RNA methyltransferase [Halalkalibacter hemicellulosilyticus]|uniref:rRNA methylase n=1 Tax=Halalkalibacter hemicellulosilyticusJCM 9152 TaxID=1236971 RepID=W4QEQ1_9BACI|nr:RNA methyltransferase [Halalkalibacter hemicellulosilyticus]GAE30148.1 rRNA methylase [Halalkalibacter hemicellulosilyticusJCM 9152]